MVLRRVAPIALACALVWPGASAGAQPATAPQLVRVASISPWMDAKHPFRLQLQVTNPTEVALEGVSVRVVFGSPVLTRSQLRAALDEGVVGGTVATIDQQVEGRIEPGAQRPVTVERSMNGALRTRGVYPATITISHSRGVVTLTTAVPNFLPSEAGPINVVWILPFTGSTIVRGRIGYTEEGVASLALPELTQQVGVLAARAGVPVTFAPSPSFVAAVAELAGQLPEGEPGVRSAAGGAATEGALPGYLDAAPLLAALREAAAGAAEIATVPYAPADVRALARADLRGDVLRQVTLGRATITAILGRAPDAGVLVPAGFALDDDAIDALGTIGTPDAAVLDATSLRAFPTEPADLGPDKFGPSAPVPIASGASSLTGLIPDAPVRARLDAATPADGVQGGVLLAQAIIAETLGSWQELPAFAPRRAFVIASAHMPDPTALAAALDGLSRAPWVKMRTASDAAEALATDGTPNGLARAALPESGYLAAARAARASLKVLTQIAIETPAETEALDRLILLAESSEWEADPAVGIGLAREASESVAAVLRGITVAERRVTLTARTGSLPITVVNNNPFTLSVRLRLLGPGVAFPAGDTHLLDLAPGDNTIDVAVEARGSGSFPLTVDVETPDGALVLAAGTLVLRSTAVSAVSLAAVAGSALFLLLAWFRRALIKDRKRARPSVEHRHAKVKRLR